MGDRLVSEETTYLQEHGIDSEEGILYCDLAEIYHTIMEMFCKGERERVDTITQDLSNNDWESYLRQVHSLKSIAKSVGADELSERARDLEYATREGNYDLVYEKNDALLKNIHETVDIFEECLLKWKVT